MAQTATRVSETRRRRGAQVGTPRPASKPGAKAQHGAKSKPATKGQSGAAAARSSRSSGSGSGGKSVPKRSSKALTSGELDGSKLARLILKRVAQRAVRKLGRAAEGRVGNAVGKAGGHRPGVGTAPLNSAMPTLLSALAPKLPVQQSIDVAVPLEFAWEAWMELHFLPEGVSRVIDINREGDELTGRVAGVPGRSWRAEVQDEREGQSFAWRSTEGSDCAGLVTFHRLSERLTRIELDLDVVPMNAMETASLLTHLAHRRTSAEMRRLKAGLEFVSPDAYAGDGEPATR